MTPSQAGYAIHPSSPEATEIGLTLDRFGPGTSLWREGISLWFSHLEILGLHPRKVLHDLVARTNARGLIAVIPQDGETVDRELLEWGFVLQSFACKDGRRVPAYLRGPRGLPLVHAEYEKFGVRLVVTDEGNDLGITVRAETPGTAVTMTVTPGSIQTESVRGSTTPG